MSFKKYSYGKQDISLIDIWFIIKALRSNFLTQGPMVKEFEKVICDYTGAKYCVAVANGTAALHLAILSLDINKNDEVITTPNTFVASANSILYAGGKVKFADIETLSANVDPSEIEKNISTNTKGIIPVHFAGQSCDMEKINAIAKKHNLFVIEDAAHAIGSDYKGYKVGSCKHSDLTTFSFHPVKTITTGEGGAITTNRKDLYEKLLMLRTHGITRNENNFLNSSDGDWYYEQQVLGFNYRISDILCALGISQLRRIEKFKQKRRMLVDLYKEEFKNDERFSFLDEKSYSNACFHLCPLLINFDQIKISKKDLFKRLKNEGLFLQVHYIPVHMQPYYQNLGFNVGDYPNAEKYYSKTISLPLYPKLNRRDIKRIVKIIKKIAV